MTSVPPVPATIIAVNIPSRVVTDGSIISVELRYDIKDWLLENIGRAAIYSSRWGWKGKWFVRSRSVKDRTISDFWQVCFFNKEDAIRFKLAWQGIM